MRKQESYRDTSDKATSPFEDRRSISKERTADVVKRPPIGGVSKPISQRRIFAT